MDFEQLRQAVSAPFRERNYDKFKALVDEFLKDARGDDYARALCLQADWVLLIDPVKATHGFLMVDEALPLLGKNPGARLSALTSALGLCYMSNDVERIPPYEEAAARLLFEHGTDPEVLSRRHRLQMNLGQVAYLRGDYATAYWHLAQAANSLAHPLVSKAERQALESVIHVNIAAACLRVRRYYEAQEALDAAEQVSIQEPHRLLVTVWRAELLRQLGRVEEASALITPLVSLTAISNSPELCARYYWTSALVAQDIGDHVRFHRFLSLAKEAAAEHRHDYLLGEIQRFQRSPM